MHFVASVDLEVLVLIMQTIAEGLVSVDCTISTSCCCSLDQLISFLFRKLSRTKKRAANQSLQMNLNNSLEPPVATHFLQVDKRSKLIARYKRMTKIEDVVSKATV